ncbi:hypothetical protein Tco_0766706 [Tanacetum coccineum]
MQCKYRHKAIKANINVKCNDDHEQADNERTKSDDEEEEKQDDKFLHTLDDYVPTDDETNEESKDVDEEEYERINGELYGDVNVSLTDAEHDDTDKGDKEMTNADTEFAEVENVILKSTGNQVKDDAQATQKTEGPILSSSISSDYAAKYLNFDNIPSVDNEVVSMLDVNVQHEVPCSLPLLSIPISIIPEHNVINPPESVTNASATTISSLLSSLFPHLQQLTPISTPRTIEATTLTTAVLDFKTLSTFHKRITDLKKDVKELKTVDHSSTLLSTIKSKVLKAVKEYLGTSLDDALHKVLQKHSADITKEHSILVEIIERFREQYVPEKSNEDIRNQDGACNTAASAQRNYHFI